MYFLGGAGVEKLLHYIREALKIICCLVLTLMSIIVFMQVVNRNLFDKSFVWVEELAGMCMVGITFLGAALATSINGHTRIDFVILKLPKRGSTIMYMVGNAICAVFVCILAYHSIPLMQGSFQSLTPRLKLPYAINYIIVLISAVLMLIYLVALIIQDWRKLKTIPKGAKNSLEESLESSMEAELNGKEELDP